MIYFSATVHVYTLYIRQYTYIVGKYKIYLYEQEEQQTSDELFWPVSQQVQINFILTDYIFISSTFI
jgi:hypothetical protein